MPDLAARMTSFWLLVLETGPSVETAVACWTLGRVGWSQRANLGLETHACIALEQAYSRWVAPSLGSGRVWFCSFSLSLELLVSFVIFFQHLGQVWVFVLPCFTPGHLVSRCQIVFFGHLQHKQSCSHFCVRFSSVQQAQIDLLQLVVLGCRPHFYQPLNHVLSRLKGLLQWFQFLGKQKILGLACGTYAIIFCKIKLYFVTAIENIFCMCVAPCHPVLYQLWELSIIVIVPLQSNDLAIGFFTLSWSYLVRPCLSLLYLSPYHQLDWLISFRQQLLPNALTVSLDLAKFAMHSDVKWSLFCN